MNRMIESAEAVSALLKLIANQHRLMILCELAEQPRNVTELVERANISQTAMSNHLAVLREANIVDFTRDHRTLTYFIKDEKSLQLLQTLHDLYCPESPVNFLQKP